MKKKKSGNQDATDAKQRPSKPIRKSDTVHGDYFSYIASLKDRIAELEGHFSGQSSNSILSEAEHLTTRDRNDSYGHPGIQYGKVAAAFNAMTGHCITRKQAITFMMILKMVRENFNPKRDNRVDLCGYANCLDMTQQAEDQGLLDEFTTGSQPGRPVAAGLHGAERLKRTGHPFPWESQGRMKNEE